jgi:hypothetical protein
MHCPACGAEIATGLNFCKSCGNNLRPPANSHALTNAPKIGHFIYLMLFTLVLITIIGLPMIVLLATKLMESGFPTNHAVTLTVIAMLGIFTTDFLLIRLISRLINAYLLQPPTPTFSIDTAKMENRNLPDYSPALSLPSVTENTTKTLDPLAAKKTPVPRSLFSN